MELNKKNMPETMYRASRFCRIIGNPTAYLILRCLDQGRMTVAELAARLQISVPTISKTLRELRNLEAVRYITSGKERHYWVKDPMVVDIQVLMEKWVDFNREMQS